MKIVKYLLGAVSTVMMMGMTVFAADYTVADANGILYTNENTQILADADTNTVVVPTVEAGLPIKVTGITSNGYFQIDLNGTYYVAGIGLTDVNNGSTTGTTGTATGTTATEKKYVWNANMVIDDPDYLFFYRDCTDEPLYIYVRDQLEEQVAQGKTICRADSYPAENTGRNNQILANVTLDMRDKYGPQWMVDTMPMTTVIEDRGETWTRVNGFPMVTYDQTVIFNVLFRIY